MMQDTKTPISPQLELPNLWHRLWPKLGFLRNVISSIPLFLLVCAYAWSDSWAVKFIGVDKRQMAVMIHLEGFAIGVFPLLAIIGLINPGPSRALKAVKFGLFGGLLLLFCWGVWDYYQFWGFFTFLSLTLATYLGFFINAGETKVKNNIIIRWLVNYVVFLFVAIILQMPQEVEAWITHKEIYNYGILFFFILSLFELFGFYRARWISQIDVVRKLKEPER